MGTEQNSPSNQTQNGSNNENNQTSAAQASGTVTNKTNSTIMEEKNLNGEDAQQQSEMTAPEAGGTKQTGEEASDGTDQGNESPAEDLIKPLLSTPAKERQEEFTKPIIEEAWMEKLKAEGYIDENGNITKRLRKKLKKLAKLSDRGCRNPMVKHLYKASELKDAGYIFCFDAENREINNNHVDELLVRIEKDKSKCYMETLKVCEVKQALLQGRRVFDIYGNEITLDTPNLEQHVVILDGQHRYIVIHENPEYDIWVDFVDTEDIGFYIDNLNNTSKAWTGEDVKHSMNEKYETPVLKEIKKFRDYFGVSEKYAELAITRKKEQYKKDDMIDIQFGDKAFNPSEFQVNELFLNSGWDIMYATLILYGTEKKVLKVEYMDAIYNIYKSSTVNGKDLFDKLILVLLTKLTSVEKSNILDCLKEKRFQDLNNYFQELYNNLKEDKAMKMEESYNKAMEIINKKKETMKTEAENSKSVNSYKRLKSGSPSDILENRKDGREDAKQKAENKAKKNKNASSNPSNDSNTSDKK